MMIRRFNNIRNLGVYQNYQWPEDLVEASKRNIVYGWNYAGKTTLSRILRALQSGRSDMLPSDVEFLISLEQGQLTQVDLGGGVATKIRVFNADFVDDNLLWKGGARSLLVMGQDSIELSSKRDALVARREIFKSKYLRIKRVHEEVAERLSRELSSLAQDVKVALSIPVFNKSPHLQGVLAKTKENPTDAQLIDSDVEREMAILRSEQKFEINRMPEISSPSGIDEAYLLLQEVASRNAISSIQGDVERWVFDGLRLHDGEGACKFCDGLIPEDRWRALHEHFSDSVNDLMRRISSSQSSLVLQGSGGPSKYQFYEDLQQKFGDLIYRYERRLSIARAMVLELNGFLEKKKSSIEFSLSAPRRSIEKVVIRANQYVDRINRVVNEHNQRVSSGEGAKIAALENMKAHLAATGYKSRDIQKIEVRLKVYGQLLKRADAVNLAYSERLKKAEADMESSSIGADKVNEYIRSYLGGDRLRVAEQAGVYRVMREGRVASTLSEGEKTAISFAYFMASLSESGLNLSEAIIWIDDPVSSMDSNHSINTFSIIKAKLSECSQLFVSTHNYEFFRMMIGDSFFKEWASRDVRRSSYFYVVRYGDASKIEWIPDSLRKFGSEYHLVFSVLNNFVRSGSGEVFLMPNLMRKMLEAYTRFRFPSSVETLDSRISRVVPDSVESARIYKLVNHLSHSDATTSVLEPPPESEVRAVAQLMMERLREHDPDHFNGLAELCA